MALTHFATMADHRRTFADTPPRIYGLEPLVRLHDRSTLGLVVREQPRWLGPRSDRPAIPSVSNAIAATRAALRQVGSAPLPGAPLHIPITGLDVDRCEFIRELELAIDRSNWSSVVLELGPHYRLHDDPATRATLAELRAHGIGFSIRDFGEGWANLGALKLLRPRVVMVSMGLLGNHDASLGFARWVVALAAALPATTVLLTGVDTIDDLRWARAAGFAAGQGRLWPVDSVL